jgi:hypothetical protein
MLDSTATDTLPEDLYSVDAMTSEPVPPNYEYIELSNCAACTAVIEYDPITGEQLPISTYEYTEPMIEGTVYMFGCDGAMDQLILPSPDLQPVLQGVAVISECRIKGQSNMRLEGVTLASLAISNSPKRPYDKATIHLLSGTYLGAQDGCAPGGGVNIYAASSVQITSSAGIMGVQIIARGDVELSANETVDGLTIQAGQDIRLTANGVFGMGCGSDGDDVFAWRWRLVH